MSSLSLKEKLALSKNVSNMENDVSKKVVRNNNIVGNINTINDAVYGNEFLNTENISNKPYDPNEELKRIKSGIPSDLSKCKLPKAIIESIRKQPLTDMSVDPKMDEFTKKLTDTIPEGIKKFSAIQDKIDEIDNKKNKTLNENNNIINSLDINDLKDFIKNTISEEVSKLSKNLLTENKNISSNPNLKAMKLGTNNFLFLDSDDNVFECKMIYKGKNKKRSK